MWTILVVEQRGRARIAVARRFQPFAICRVAARSAHRDALRQRLAGVLGEALLPDVRHTLSVMSDRGCSSCGENSLEPGFLEDTGQAARGYTRWVEGALDLGIFGGAKVMGRPRRTVEAVRCTSCGHLDLFTGDYT